MSDPVLPEGMGADPLAVLAVVRRMAAVALASTEPEQVDQDITDALIDGLLALVTGARVVRVRLNVAGQTVDDAAFESVEAMESLGEPAVRRALASSEPMTRRGPAGEIAALMAPLVSRAGAIDVFILEAEAAGPGLTDFDAAVIATLRDQAAAALAVRQAQAQARIDPLTGCLNHGAMHAQLAKEVARVQRTSGQLALVMLDLDDFKSINELYGHPTGDKILSSSAAGMLEACRRYDTCCRYGGDEFVVILPDTGIADAIAAAQRLRAAVAASFVERDGARIGVAATAGVADWRAGDSSVDLIARVDQALIAGKAAGKDDIGVA